MRLPQSISRTIIAIVASVLILAGAGAPSAFPQSRAASGAGESAMWTALRNTKGTLLGSMRLAVCSPSPSAPCRDYLIRAIGYRLPGLNPTKLIVTDTDLHKVVFVDHDVYGFLYMFPLNQWGSLLATVWGSGTTNGIVQIYQLSGNSVKRVFEKGSRFSPQFVAANEATPIPLILLDRYTGGIEEIRPQQTEIWRWNATEGKFDLRATVPVDQRFETVAKIEREARKQ